MAVVIPKEYFSVLETAGEKEVYSPKKHVFTQGDEASYFYIVAKGRVRVYSISHTGQERTIEILEEGRIFGDSSFLTNSRRAVTIEAVTECEIIKYEVEQLVTMCAKSHGLMRLVFQHMAETCNYLTGQIVQSSHYNSTQKVAAFLLGETANRKKSVLPYTHDEIAASVALNRVTVSRIMSDFKARKLVTSRYGTIEVVDRQGLENLLPQ